MLSTEEYKCPFYQTLRSEAFGCAQGLAVTRRDGPDVCCTSQPAQERCAALFRTMKQSALPAFGVDDDPQQMPHSILVKIQFGGLLSLQRHLGLASADFDRVENIHELVAHAVSTFGSVADIPCADLVPDITAYKVKRRRGR